MIMVGDGRDFSGNFNVIYNNYEYDEYDSNPWYIAIRCCGNSNDAAADDDKVWFGCMEFRTSHTVTIVVVVVVVVVYDDDNWW